MPIANKKKKIYHKWEERLFLTKKEYINIVAIASSVIIAKYSGIILYLKNTLPPRAKNRTI
jgi:hypothetical protein